MSENKYTELKDRQEKEYNQFPFMFAFDQKQFDDGMRKLGLETTDLEKVCSVGGGGYIKKTDSKRLLEMYERFDKELNEAIAEDTTGEGFIKDMFEYELANHEYCITYEVDETLDSLGLKFEDVENNPIMMNALRKACKKNLRDSQGGY